MLYAIVSDIHANLRAWSAVLDDMAGFGPDVTLCLGDVVGYGPVPGEVLESVCEYVDEIVIGNHDAVVAGRYSPESFNDNARRVIDWTRDQLSDDVIEFFADLPADLDGENFTITHAELGNPERFDYVENESMARESFEACDSDIVFVGHTHHAGIFVWDTAMNNIMRYPPTDFAALPDMRYIVNAGSVGDPRTDDLRASYCLYDSELREVFFRKVPFDIEAYRRDVQESTLPMPPFCLTIGRDVDEYMANTLERSTIVVTREKRPRLRISKGVMTAGVADQDPATALALECLEQEAERERKRKREAIQQSLTASLEISQRRHKETVAKLKELHAAKRRQAQERAEAERLESERNEREREERAKEKRLEAAQSAATRIRVDRERAEKRAIEQREMARLAIEQKKRQAEQRRVKEAEEAARKAAETDAKRAALTAQRKLEQEKQALAAERRRLEEERRQLEAERQRLAGAALAPQPALPIAQPAASPLDKSKTAKLTLPKAVAPAAPPPTQPGSSVPLARTVSETAQIDEIEEDAPPSAGPAAVDLLQQINAEEVDSETARLLRLQVIREATEAKESERRRKLAEKKAAQVAAQAAAREAIRKRQEAARRKREQ